MGLFRVNDDWPIAIDKDVTRLALISFSSFRNEAAIAS